MAFNSAGVLNLDDFARLARRRMPRALYAYVAGGAGDGTSLRHNRAAFDQWRLLPRMLRGTATRSLRRRILDQDCALPFGITPLGAAAVLGYQADLVMARVARAAGIVHVLSANSITPMEAVIAENPDSWFDAYLPSDPAIIEGMVARTARAGFKVLMVTVDVPVPAFREDELRLGYAMPFQLKAQLVADMALHPRWLAGQFGRTLLARRGIPHIANVLPEGGPSIFARNVGAVGGAEAFDWENIRAIRRQWDGRLVLKGILSPEDAAIAQEIGVDAIAVGNHGARQLHTVVSPMEVLAQIRARCPEMTLLADSGFRRATDILKAIALGADGVLIGRPFLYATVLGGEAGLGHAIGLLRRELYRDMAFLGIAALDEMGIDHMVGAGRPVPTLPTASAPSTPKPRRKAVRPRGAVRDDVEKNADAVPLP